MKRKYIYILVIILLIMQIGCAVVPDDKKTVEIEQSVEIDMKKSGIKNTYDTLNVATYISRINGIYYINDCYHNQIIYHTELNPDLRTWNVLTADTNYPHTIAGDGKVLLLDDTDNNRVLVYQYINGVYEQTQNIENVGLKPHFVQYEPNREIFYVWSSITGELYHMKRNPETDEVYISEIKKIDELFAVYVRSFTIIGDDIYFVSGHNNQKIIKADLDSLEIQEEFEVPPQIAGMVQLTKIEDYYYLTISTDANENQDFATIIRTKDLHNLATGEYEDIYEQFGLDKGTPYFISEIDGMYYMTHHRTAQNIISFQVRENQIENVKVLY